MLKNHKGKLILSSVVILLPALLGALLWNRLPENMTTHWGGDGVADGWSSRAVAVFVMPLILLALHWLCLWITSKDRKNKDQSKKAFGMVFWISPLLSLFTSGITYATALGRDLQNDTLGLAFLGLIFVVIGNYLPKTKQNYTIGIKIKWALASEENWNATHRLAGKLWVAGGLGMMACIFLPIKLIPVVLPILLVVIAVIPMVYSWWYYRKQAQAGEVPEKAVMALPPWSRGVRTVVLAFTAVLLVFVVVICFTGNIDVEYGTDRFTIQASYWDDLTVRYEDITCVGWEEDFSPGSRTFGFGSPRLSMGTSQNEDFGTYTLYAYTGCDAVAVLEVNGRYLVFGGKTEEQTIELYHQILEHR